MYVLFHHVVEILTDSKVQANRRATAWFRLNFVFHGNFSLFCCCPRCIYSISTLHFIDFYCYSAMMLWWRWLQQLATPAADNGASRETKFQCKASYSSVMDITIHTLFGYGRFVCLLGIFRFSNFNLLIGMLWMPNRGSSHLTTMFVYLFALRVLFVFLCGVTNDAMYNISQFVYSKVHMTR